MIKSEVVIDAEEYVERVCMSHLNNGSPLNCR